MKAIFIGLLILFFVQSASSQNVFIYGEKGEKIYFQETDSIVQIKFRKNTDPSEQIRIAKFVNPDIAISGSKNNRVSLTVKKR